MFIDYAKITVISGNGGPGAVSFHRAKFVPKGGPDGGDGGRGGDLIFQADSSLSTLQDFKYKRKYNAENGKSGSGNNRSGRGGKSVIVRVPPGTVIKDAESGGMLLDMVAPGVKTVLLEGGIGGKGNARFATSTNRAPRHAQPGISGHSLDIILELKSMADVGLVGLPNAGKSTLLASVSAARPRVADYPFTTLQPQLGIVEYAPYKSFVMADIPGLIENAHIGKGLGHYFLRHIERTSVLLYMVDVSDADPAATLKLLQKELSAHDPELRRKPSLVLITKSDLITPDFQPAVDEEEDPALTAMVPYPEMEHDFLISAATRNGIKKLVQRIGLLVEKERADREIEYKHVNYLNSELLGKILAPSL